MFSLWRNNSLRSKTTRPTILRSNITCNLIHLKSKLNSLKTMVELVPRCRFPNKKSNSKCKTIALWHRIKARVCKFLRLKLKIFQAIKTSEAPVTIWANCRHNKDLKIFLISVRTIKVWTDNWEVTVLPLLNLEVTQTSSEEKVSSISSSKINSSNWDPDWIALHLLKTQIYIFRSRKDSDKTVLRHKLLMVQNHNSKICRINPIKLANRA